MLHLRRKSTLSEIIPEESATELLSCDDLAPVPTCSTPLVELSICKDSPVTWSEDGKLFAFIDSNYSIIIYKHSDDGNYRYAVLVGHRSKITNCIILSHTSLLSCGREGLFVWDLSNQCCKHSFLAKEGMIPKEGLSCIYYINSDDTLLAGSFDGSLLLIDVCTFQLLDKVTAQRDTILQIVYSRKLQTIITFGIDTSVNLWAIQNSKIHYIKSFDSCIGRNKTIALSMDESSLFCRFDSKEIQLWSISSCEKVGVIDLTPDQNNRGNLVYIKQQNQNDLLCCYSSGIIQYCSMYQSTPPSSLSSESLMSLRHLLSGDVNNYEDTLFGFDIVFEKDLMCGRLHHSIMQNDALLLSTDHSICIYQMDIQHHDFILKQNYHFHSDSITTLILDSNSLFSISRDHDMIHYETTTFSSVSHCVSPTSIQSMIMYQNQLYSGGSDYQIHVFSTIPTLQRKYPVFKCSSQIHCLAIHQHTGCLLIGTDDGTLILCTENKGTIGAIGTTPQIRKTDHVGTILAVDVQQTKESSFLVATGGSDYSLRVYQRKGEKLVEQWSQENAHYGAVTALVFGKKQCAHLLFTGGFDTNIHIWNGMTGELIGELTAHQQKIHSLFISDDGKYLVSAGADKIVIIWDIENHYHVKGKYLCDDECTCAQMNSQILACGYLSGVIRIWPIFTSSTQPLFSFTQMNCSPLEKESFRLEFTVSNKHNTQYLQIL